MGILNENLYRKYFRRILGQKKQINKMIKNKILKKNKVLIGYGAPAKVTTFSYTFDLGKNHIRYIVDDNYLKQDKYTPGKNIKIIKFENLKKISFDYIIILAWNFSNPIIKKLNKKFKNRNFKIIVPFPKLKIY